MSTLKQLRLQAHLSINGLAKLADVDRLTVEKAEDGTPVRDYIAYAIVEALNDKLGKQLSIEDVDGLNIL
jgi:predicted transcriptional regulator